MNNKKNKQPSYLEGVKEVVILTAAVGIIAAAGYFQFCAAAVIGDYHDFECGAAGDRIFYLRQGIWYKNGLYKHYAACIYRYF